MTSNSTATQKRVAAYQAARRRHLIRRGQWQPFADAQPVREHVENIRAAGMSLAGIAKYTGVNIGSLDHLLYGSHPYPPAARIRTESAEALLAYWPTLDHYDDLAVINGPGTRRRMQALAAAGWTAAAVHEHVHHITCKAVENLRYRERVTARTARAVRDFYNRVSDQPAEAHGITPWVAARTRTWATKYNWVPAIAWDDDTIDNPDAHPEWTGHCGTDRGWWTHKLQRIPVCPRCETAHTEWREQHKNLPQEERFRAVGRARAEASSREADLAHDAREIKRLTGADDEQAAARLGVTRQHLQQALRRNPETDYQAAA